MIPLESAIENQVVSLQELEEKLKPLGMVIGSSWEYDHGYFDYQLGNEDQYYFLRIPFQAEIGQLDEIGVMVRIGQPFVLGHQYEKGNDDQGVTGTLSASINQFQAPVDPDSEVPDKYIEKAREFMQKVEQTLLS
jgi:hypothetical protein